MIFVPFSYKFFIYFLTFFTHFQFGRSDFLSILERFALNPETNFVNFLDNVINFAGRFQYSRQVLNAAVEEFCVFRCQTGSPPILNLNYTPQSNGCGSLGLKISHRFLPLSEMTKCCDHHDFCYDTCNSDKEKCDMDFKSCLYKHCVDYKPSGEDVVNKCKATAKILFMGTLGLGCKSYMDAQENACHCPT